MADDLDAILERNRVACCACDGRGTTLTWYTTTSPLPCRYCAGTGVVQNDDVVMLVELVRRLRKAASDG